MSQSATTHEFQAEVRQVLDIVIHSLYTDREIFIRELVSNAADSLEKMRLTQLTEKEIHEPQAELKISISSDETAGTITLADSGIGMSREELTQNLGTIAHSGSKAFAAALKNAGKSKDATLIGQFGVGFYSAFMVAEEVKVFTRDWRPGGQSLCWTSTGSGTYSIEEVPDQNRGCRIVIKLKEDARDFAKANTLRRIINQYSNFIAFPLELNAERLNTVEAIWLKPREEISAEQYESFYQFAAKAFDKPSYHLHFQADAPLVINALIFLPSQNQELFGMGQMEPGVALYCKKVLIDPHPPKLLPEWLRFARGVIDSEDLPLNISRESMQDSSLVRKLGEVVTKRLLKFLDKEAQDSPDSYLEFYAKFSRFFKEGIVTDFANRDAIAKLLRFDSSLCEVGKPCSLQDYVQRMPSTQECIYYQTGPSRSAIESGPYLEAFKAKGFEVLFLHEPMDEYVINSLGEFEGKRLLSVNSPEVDLGDLEQGGEALDETTLAQLNEWLKTELGDTVEEVRSSKRLVGAPVLAITPEGGLTPQMRQMMRAMKPDEVPQVKVILEINPRHDLVRKLEQTRQTNPQLAALVGAQLLDNALLSAGLLDEPQRMVSRLEKLMANLPT